MRFGPIAKTYLCEFRTAGTVATYPTNIIVSISITACEKYQRGVSTARQQSHNIEIYYLGKNVVRMR